MDNTINKALEQYKDNLKKFEGNYDNASFIHRPTKGSGITIGLGLDSYATSKEDMKRLGIPDRIIEEIEIDNGFTKNRTSISFEEKSKKYIERMTKEEFDNHVDLVARDKIKFISDIHSKNKNLSAKSLAILSNVKHWAGGFEDNTSKVTRYESSLKGSKKQYGRKISPIQEVLNNKDATDKDLINALKIIKESYEPFEEKGKTSYRYSTITKYIKNLEDK